MWNAAHFADELTIAGDYGFPLTPPVFDWACFKTARDTFIERLNGIYLRNLESSNYWRSFECFAPSKKAIKANAFQPASGL